MSKKEQMKAGCLKRVLLIFLGVIVAAVVITYVRRQRSDESAGPRQRETRAMPVEAEPVLIGPMAQRRLFSGTLEPSARLVVAPKISARIARILVDLSDRVERGTMVVLLEDDEFEQAVTSATADLAVATAQAEEAANRQDLAQRELERVRTLEERGVASSAALDSAETEFIMRQSALQVAQANLQAREAALATARIRLGYTRVTATWSDGDPERVVAERFVDEGDTVAANTPLLAVVSMRPIRSVFFVPERDYALLRPGQEVLLRADAFPNETFAGQVNRISPVFRQESRQARIEVAAENADERLKPGMFVRATVVLQTIDEARSVPAAALTRRGGEIGLFMVDETDGTDTARWVVVETGIESENRVQILQPELVGLVVTLGQQLLADGVPVRVVGDE